jgi:predicted GIY-YIG superfamily endonuclease
MASRAERSGVEGRIMYDVYILRCADGAFYVGHTRDVSARVGLHNTGRGPAFTACRRPVVLVYAERFLAEGEAVDRERQIKRWSRAKKAALVASDKEALKRLSRCRRMC